MFTYVDSINYFIENVLPWILGILLGLSCCLLCLNYQNRTNCFEDNDNGFVYTKIQEDYLKK